MAVDGILSIHPKGFGFVNRSDGEDVFLPPRVIFKTDAHEGAHVQADIVEYTPKGPVGYILLVHGPLPDPFEGVVCKGGDRLYVEPDLEQLDSGTPPQALVINDTDDISPGDRVKASLQEGGIDVRCKVTQVLDQGVTGAIKRAAIDAGMERRSTTRMKKTPTFSTDRRRDLTDRPTIVIDPEDAYDHDDAVSIKKENGGWELGVHIADVSAYVQPDSQLDKRARQNANTVYLPGRTYPMLPENLTQAASLGGGDNRALSILLHVDRDGTTSINDVVESTIHVDEQLTYKTAQQQYENNQASTALNELGQAVDVLADQRAKRAIIMDGGDVRPTIEDEAVTSLKRRSMTKAHRLIEESMIAANHHIARWLKQNNAPVLYRHHPPPESDAIQELKDHFSSARNASMPRECFKAIIDTVEPGTLDYTFAVERLKRAMEKAVYQTQPGPHFGLGLDRYAHFTSPIRRYADLLNHRSVKQTLRGQSTGAVQEAMNQASDHLVQYEQRTIDLEREVRSICSIYYVKNHDVGSTDGVVVDHYKALSFVELTNGISGAYNGKLPLGTKNTFRIANTDLIKREIDLIPASI